jgi:hypothetical protein
VPTREDGDNSPQYRRKNEIIAEAIFDLSKSIRLLGNGNIDRGDLGVGAIEGLAMLIRDSNQKISESIGDVAEAIRKLAQAIENKEK